MNSAQWGGHLAFALATALVVGTAAAEEITYRVEAGDTLIGVAERLLAEPARWPRLQRLNRIEDPYRLPVGSALRIPVALLKPQARKAEVLATAGAPTADGQALAVGATVGAGTRLDSGDAGHVVLRLPDGSRLVLPARSAMRIETLNGYAGTEAQDLRVQLERGRVESRVEPQRGPAARYRVDTPTAVIGVRGTDFRVGIDGAEGASRAEVTEGRVAVKLPAARAAREREVPAGFGWVVNAAGGDVVPLLPAPSMAEVPVLFEQPVLRVPLPALPGAVAWRAEIAPDRPDAEVLAAQHVDAGPLRVPGLEDGQYRMVLRGIDARGLEGRDGVHVFRLKARPEPPFLGAPADRGKVVEGPVAFEWSEAPQAASYRLQLSAGEDFAQPLAEVDSLKATGYRHELAPGQYRWRVQSVRPDGDRGPWGPAAAFTVRPRPQTPEPPAIGDADMTFRWSGEPGQRFEYQFAADEGFAALRHEGAVAEPVVTLPRPSYGTYWMRVRAIDPDGFVSPWTGAQKVAVPMTFPWWILPFIPLLF